MDCGHYLNLNLNMPTHLDNNYLSFYMGHDCTFSIYNANRDRFYTVELEKLLGIKHFRWSNEKQNPVYVHDYDYIIKKFIEALDELGIGRHFKFFICAERRINNEEFEYVKKLLVKYGVTFDQSENFRGHHISHVWSAIGQMPPNKGVVVTCDGGGEDGVFSISTFNRENSTFKKRGAITKEQGIGGYVEEWAFTYLDSIAQNSPSAQDLAGKVMGAAGFGKPTDFIKKSHWNLAELNKLGLAGYSTAASYYGETHRHRFLNKNHMTFEEEADVCHQIQLNLEKMFEETCLKVCPNFPDLLNNFDNQLILSGGVALNIINNKKLEEKYGCKVWVPCNPGDNGLPFGTLYKWLLSNKVINFSTNHRYDNALTGPRVRDEKHVSSYRKVYGSKNYKVSIEEVAQFLKDGEVIGLMQGNSESGFRALGHRSILCDASYPDIKDRVNKIKRREVYRPFAPMCLWKNAHKWFNVSGENNYKHMNIGVTVKEEFKEKLASITHVDGTARLQAIDDAGFIEQLLQIHGGVLLNTSLNLSGKPICNSLYEALHILERSSLDKLIVEIPDEGLTCFEHHRNETI